MPGLREGSTEAARVLASLLSDLIDRGLHARRMRLWVIDGGKALPWAEGPFVLGSCGGWRGRA